MYENLMEEALREENCEQALKAVMRNKGAAGIDRMPVSELKSHLQTHGEKIKAKLRAGTYVPSPVLLLQVLTPIFDPQFSKHSYGFRPGRSAHDPVQAAQRFVREGKQWVVDLDITKFFDHVNHDILMSRIAAVIRDKRAIRLIGQYLRRGALENGVVTASEEGTPQGGPILARLRSTAETLSVIERQKIVRLLVKDVLVGEVRSCFS